MNLRGWITSAVPSQLLPTYSTSRSTGRFRLAASAPAGTSASPRPATASTATGTMARRIIVPVCLPPAGANHAARHTAVMLQVIVPSVTDPGP